MEGLGVNFLSAPAPAATNSLQKDEVHAQVCNRMLQQSEPVDKKYWLHCIPKNYTLFMKLSYLFMCFSSLFFLLQEVD